MRLRAVHPGDVVLANLPLVKAREVVDHWTHAAAGRDERPPDAQLAFDGL